MIDREHKTEKVAASADDPETSSRKASTKHEKKQVGFDVLADEDPQICRGID